MQQIKTIKIHPAIGVARVGNAPARYTTTRPTSQPAKE
jgi:hypothetical protein